VTSTNAENLAGEVKASKGQPWRVLKWFAYCLAALTAITALLWCIGAFVPMLGLIGFELGLSLLALLSFAATVFAVGLAAAIYRHQAVQAELDKLGHEAVLDEIRRSASDAAGSAHSADTNTNLIIKIINEAARSRIGHTLDADREAALANSLRETKTVGESPILWVDDDPDSLKLERKAISAAGMATIWVSNTARALDLLEKNYFGLVITDMGRVEGHREGYALLDEMRHRGDKTPVVVYSGSDDPEHLRETLAHGGDGATNDPSRLFEYVMALQSGSNPH